jgi:hypothetical protein
MFKLFTDIVTYGVPFNTHTNTHTRIEQALYIILLKCHYIFGTCFLHQLPWPSVSYSSVCYTSKQGKHAGCCEYHITTKEKEAS